MRSVLRTGLKRTEGNEMNYATYTVTVTPTIPTWQLKEYTVEVYAKDRAKAIKQAREEFRASWQDWGHGPATYRAKLAAE
jgi:hypothetical protein